MKRLAASTVQRLFEERGWYVGQGMGYLGRSNLGLENDRGMLKISDGRWTERSNVHIVSYWTWPTTLNEARKMIGDIEYTYAKLCGVAFDFAFVRPKKKFNRRIVL